ncbi:unnamed protein product [Fraxinus pennsylvanica]|uniref:Uncharacterized protein n=1 Tax=Fraxinus pennsylvanica TaxID=56036 RepID=A0AAD1Z9G0_9LAMI|nr:unnamed protein product [Fraxinus pennsylvanica]
MGEEERAVEQTPPDAMLDSIEALLEAARFDDIDDVISIASAGVSLDSKDSQGRTALHMAAANGHLDIINYLLLNGADVNASNVENNTPLHWACLNGHVEAVKHLILAGANVSALNSHERTPMDEAVSREKMDIIDAVSEAVAQGFGVRKKNSSLADDNTLIWRLADGRESFLSPTRMTATPGN